LLGDPGRIRQVLLNLVGNAIKFTAQGEIVVRVQEESVEGGATCLRFSVKDTGVGIPVDSQRMIFEAFSQADSSTTRKYGGTGLGLAICTRLVSLMGGRIWVESESGQGSTFHFTVRLAVQDKPAGVPVESRLEQLRDVTALIVDDNYTNREVLRGMLTRWGMRPTAVESGRAALEELEIAKNAGRPYALILSDGRMPEMDGFELAKKIKNDPKVEGGTVMMLTSAGQLGDAACCRELKISAYLMKPIRPQELREALCSVLAKETQARGEVVTRHSLRERRHRSRVLLAEDNAVNRVLAVRLLERRGFLVTTAGDGREALAALKKEIFDVVLMDIQMPEMDGFEATLVIREKEKSTGRHIPIIAMTAEAMKGDQERCLAAGMDAYISKPVNTEKMFAAIASVLHKNDEAEAANDGGESRMPSEEIAIALKLKH
jgi:CheY-like chemotaxis protein